MRTACVAFAWIGFAFIPMPSMLLGERLAELRALLKSSSEDPKAWSRPAVAHAAGVSPAALTRVERQGTGSAATLAALLRFYQAKAISLEWILFPDKSEVPLYAFQEIAHHSQGVAEVCHLLVALRKRVQPALNGCLTAEEPPAESIAALLMQVQKQTHQALVYLLPLMRYVATAADLRAYQQYLPPVPAHSAGWRTRAAHVLPGHYYEAGESLPLCGDPYAYLAYDSDPIALMDMLCCQDCLAQQNTK